jgi:hypothetical protein
MNFAEPRGKLRLSELAVVKEAKGELDEDEDDDEEAQDLMVRVEVAGLGLLAGFRFSDGG